MVNSVLQPGVEVRDLHSHILNQELRLYIKLPWRYAQNNTSYPVLFSLDGNRSFPLYSTMSLIYETPGTDSPEILIVGVGYKVDNERIKGLAQWAVWRTRDLTPEYREDINQSLSKVISTVSGAEELDIRSGGASLYLQSLREEIIPFIEKNYRVSSMDRGLAGYSYGGLFVLYTLFHHSELFTRYFAGSPSLLEVVFEYEDIYASKHNDLRARLFITAGEHESELVESLKQLTGRLGARNYAGLEIQTHVFEGEGHRSAYAAAISRALAVLYCEDWLT